jgi:hypothetical protein
MLRWTALLLSLLSGAAHSDWSQGEAPTYSYVAVSNDDGQMLGQSCAVADGYCRWIVTTEDMCEPGKTETPAVISGSAGGVAATLVCLDSVVAQGKTLYRLGVAPFDDVDKVFRQTGTVGIAFPLQSGQFRVVRFSLGGDSAAIDRMRASALRRVKASTKSQTL